MRKRAASLACVLQSMSMWLPVEKERETRCLNPACVIKSQKELCLFLTFVSGPMICSGYTADVELIICGGECVLSNVLLLALIPLFYPTWILSVLLLSALLDNVSGPTHVDCMSRWLTYRRPVARSFHAAQPRLTGQTVEATSSTFEKLVTKADHPVIVDFYAEYVCCLDCLEKTRLTHPV